MIKLHQDACLWGGPGGGNKKEGQKCVRNCINKNEITKKLNSWGKKINAQRQNNYRFKAYFLQRVSP